MDKRSYYQRFEVVSIQKKDKGEMQTVTVKKKHITRAKKPWSSDRLIKK